MENEEIVRLRAEVADLRDALKAHAEGGSTGADRLALKIVRQREALDRLHTRVVNQRFYLRTLNELGRGLTKEEYEVARDAVQNEQVKERLVGVPS